MDVIGIYYGYPTCCILSFITEKPRGPRISRNQIKVSQRTGFIPCSYCTWKIMSKQCKLEDLITNRVCETPFPISTNKFILTRI
jgi:hypothetical protein